MNTTTHVCHMVVRFSGAGGVVFPGRYRNTKCNVRSDESPLDFN